VTWNEVDLAAPEFAQPADPPVTARLIYRNKRHALSGPPEAAKTLTALILGLEHHRGGHGRFALVDFEMGEHAVRLLLVELGATLDEIRDVYYVAPDGPPDALDIAAIAEAAVTLVVIDAAAGAYDASGLDDNKRGDAEAFARTWVRPLFERGIATILLDHVTKNPDTRGRYAIGSERKLGTVDVHLGLQAVKQLHRGADGLVTITVHKDRPGHLQRPRAAELEFRSDPETHQIRWDFLSAPTSIEEAAWLPTVLMQKVSRFLEAQTAPVSQNTISRARLGRKVEYVRQALDALVTLGYAAETAGSRGARLYESTRLFTSTDLDPTSTVEVAPTSTDFDRPLQGVEVEVEDEDNRYGSNEVARLEAKRQEFGL